MARLLKTLVVIQFLLAVAALVLGCMLFQKRQILMGRTRKLEQTILALGYTLEAETPAGPAQDWPARDIDRVGSTLIDNPERSEFWKTYPTALEQEATVMLDLRERIPELQSYYLIDPITEAPVRNPLTGEKVTTGPGTMDAVLKEVLATSDAQLERLNATRKQLRTTRDELIVTIEDLNTRKGELRFALKTIDDRDSVIVAKNAEIRDLVETIAVRDDRIKALDDVLAQKQEDLNFQMETNEVMAERIAWLEVVAFGDNKNRPWETPGWSEGPKGKVAAVNQEWKFVVLDLTEDFVQEYDTLARRNNEKPKVDLFVTRPRNGDVDYICKIKLDHITHADRKGVASIASDWQQSAILPGDGVIY